MSNRINLPRSHYQQAKEHFKGIGGDVKNILADIMSECGGTEYRDVYHYISSGMANLPDKDRINISYHTNVIFHLTNLLKYGEQIYYVAPQMAVRLATTELNVDVSYLKSPFKELFIQVDRGLFKIKSTEGGVVDVDGIYVYLDDMGDGGKEFRIMAVAMYEPTPDIPFNDSTFFFNMPLYPGQKLKSAVRERVDYVLKEQLDDITRSGGIENLPYTEQLAGFVFNTLLYVTSKDPHVRKMLPRDFAAEMAGKKNKGKIRKLARQMEKSNTLPVYLISSPSPISDTDVEEAKRSGGVFSWKLEKRVNVSGHWRGQWYGSEKLGTRRRETVYIDSYTKGLAYEVESKRIRKVGRK